MHGHVGEVANELADGLAGIASLGRCSTAPFAIALERWLAENALAARWLPHVCLTRVHPEALPELRQGVLSWPLQAPPDRLPAELSIAPFMRPLQQPSTQAHTVSRLCNWTAVTFNALSLLSADVATPDGVEEGTGLYGAVGRIALLEAALAEVDVFIAGIQEARTPYGMVRGGCYTRYCSGCNDRKCYGVELWVANGQTMPSHTATALVADTCRLIVRLEVSGSVKSWRWLRTRLTVRTPSRLAANGGASRVRCACDIW